MKLLVQQLALPRVHALKILDILSYYHFCFVSFSSDKYLTCLGIKLLQMSEVGFHLLDDFVNFALAVTMLLLLITMMMIIIYLAQ